MDEISNVICYKSKNHSITVCVQCCLGVIRGSTVELTPVTPVFSTLNLKIYVEFNLNTVNESVSDVS